jgi:hypothetical protein
MGTCSNLTKVRLKIKDNPALPRVVTCLAGEDILIFSQPLTLRHMSLTLSLFPRFFSFSLSPSRMFTHSSPHLTYSLLLPFPLFLSYFCHAAATCPTPLSLFSSLLPFPLSMAECSFLSLLPFPFSSLQPQTH